MRPMGASRHNMTVIILMALLAVNPHGLSSPQRPAPLRVQG
jgi:hypothetical protein